MTPIVDHGKTVAALRKDDSHGTQPWHPALISDAYANSPEKFAETGLLSETSPKRRRALPDFVLWAGG